MIKVHLSAQLRKPGQSDVFTIHSAKDLGRILVSNLHLYKRLRETDDRRYFVVAKIPTIEQAQVITALLIREVFAEDTQNITYSPKSGLLLVFFGNKLNWITNVQDKIKSAITRGMLMESPCKAKDSWGESLVTKGE